MAVPNLYLRICCAGNAHCAMTRVRDSCARSQCSAGDPAAQRDAAALVHAVGPSAAPALSSSISCCRSGSRSQQPPPPRGPSLISMFSLTGCRWGTCTFFCQLGFCRGFVSYLSITTSVRRPTCLSGAQTALAGRGCFFFCCRLVPPALNLLATAALALGPGQAGPTMRAQGPHPNSR